MDPAVFSTLLKENENITLKVQTKLKLLREQLAQVRNQKVLLEESLAEVESFNYLAPSASTKNNTVDVNVAVSTTSTSHHSEYYLRRFNISEIPRNDEIITSNNHHHNEEEEEEDDNNLEERNKMIHQTHKVLSLFPFPCDRFSWTIQSQTVLKSLVRTKLEKIIPNQKSNKNISFSNADWEEIAEGLRNRYYSSDLIDHFSNEMKTQASLRIPSGPACKIHFFSLMKHQKTNDNNNEKNTSRNGNKNENSASVNANNNDEVEALILKAFGISYENNSKNQKRSEQRKPQVEMRPIICIQGESHTYVRNLAEEESWRISQFWKLYVEKILKVCDDDRDVHDDDDETNEHQAMTPQERRNQLKSLLEEVAFPKKGNTASSLSTAFEKLSIINYIKQKFFYAARNLPRISMPEVDFQMICGAPSSPALLSSSPIDDFFTRIKYFSRSETVLLRTPEGPTSLIHPYFSRIKMLHDYDIDKRYIASRISPELFVWLSKENNNNSNNNNNNCVVNNEKKLQIVLLLFTLLVSSVGTSGQKRLNAADSDDNENSETINNNKNADVTSSSIIKASLARLLETKISSITKLEEDFSSVYPTFLSRNSASLCVTRSGGEVLRAFSGSSVMSDRNLETIFNFLYFSVGGEFFKNPVDDVAIVGNDEDDEDDDDEDVPLLDIALRKHRVQMIRTRHQYSKLRQILNLPSTTFRLMD